MLELDNLTKTYGGRTVLARLSHVFEAGRFVASMGESGVGKSTLLNLIAGLDAADSGEVIVDGTAMAALDDDAGDPRTNLRNPGRRDSAGQFPDDGTGLRPHREGPDFGLGRCCDSCGYRRRFIASSQ